MRLTKLVYCTLVAFWASVPLFAVYLAASWALGADPFAWPGMVLWVVVLATSAYLTVATQASAAAREEGAVGEARQTPDTLVYPLTLILASSLYSFQLF